MGYSIMIIIKQAQARRMISADPPLPEAAIAQKTMKPAISIREIYAEIKTLIYVSPPNI